MIEEFNVYSKAECDQLNLTHETRTKNASAHLVQVQEPWRLSGRNKKTMEERIYAHNTAILRSNTSKLATRLMCKVNAPGASGVVVFDFAVVLNLWFS